ncbi:MAG: C1 family peptidase, partial [Anaerolineae bacterium]
VLLFTLSSSALSNPYPQPPPPPTEVRLSTEDDGRHVELKEGQLLVITLEANPSTGYIWEVAGPDEKVLRQVGDIEFEQESNLLGAPGRQAIRFQAVGEGQATLRLVYRRPWEEGVEPAKTFSLQVQAVGPFTDVDSSPTTFDTPATTEPKSSLESPLPVPGQSQLGLPPSFNWCDAGGCTPVQNQGNCGSCWAFGTVGPFESKILIHDALTKDLSEQYLLSCNTDGWTCDGGWWAHDYHLDKIPPGQSDAGAVYEADFPYVASQVACIPSLDHHEKIDSWAFVGPEYGTPSAADIRQAIYDHGPVSVAVCAGSAFQSYTTSVFETNESCFPYDVNHAVVLVGWDDADGAWILRNSWGSGWGESGYMRIQYGISNVGYSANYIVYSPSIPLTNTVHLPLVMKNYSSLPSPPSGPFYSVADACVLEGYPTTNFGNTVDMWAGYDDYLEPDGKIARSLIQFDLSAIPTGTPIDSALLQVYLVSSYDFPGETRTITAYRIPSTWSESSVTWNTRPSYGEAYGSASVTHGAWAWYSFDVTNLVRGWVNGTLPNYGVMLRGPEWSGYDSSWRAFSAREGSYTPQLVITYTGYPASGKAQVGSESLGVGEPGHTIIKALTGTPKSRLPSADLCQDQPPVGKKCLALQ